MRIALAVLFAIAVVAPTSFEASAAGSKKKCMATTLDNKKVSFVCKVSQKCCYDAIANKGTCVAANAVCL